MLAIEFDAPVLERQTIRDRYDLLLGVVATLRILTSREVLYEEPMFPIVELRAQFVPWLETGVDARRNFEFQSMESEEPDLVWIRWSNRGWHVGARHQLRSEERTFDDREIQIAAQAFVNKVEAWVQRECHIDLAGCH